MELDLYLDMCPDMIVRIFICIALMVCVALCANVVIATSKQSKTKDKKEVESNDIGGNKKGSSKTDVH